MYLLSVFPVLYIVYSLMKKCVLFILHISVDCVRCTCHSTPPVRITERISQKPDSVSIFCPWVFHIVLSKLIRVNIAIYKLGFSRIKPIENIELIKSIMKLPRCRCSAPTCMCMVCLRRPVGRFVLNWLSYWSIGLITEKFDL